MILLESKRDALRRSCLKLVSHQSKLSSALGQDEEREETELFTQTHKHLHTSTST